MPLFRALPLPRLLGGIALLGLMLDVPAARAQVAVTSTVSGVVGTVASTTTAGTTTTAGNVGGGATAGGILIDAQGVVKTVFASDPNEQLAKRRMTAIAGQNLSPDVNKWSDLRKVSLVRLEKALESFADERKDATAEMSFLAGLQRIDYVFVYPEEKDIVIAGPAEGFAPDAVGRVVGVTSRRPPLRLDDLMVALRSLQRAGGIGCSIDPVQSRLAAFNQYVKTNNAPTTRDQVAGRYQEMARILGMQDVKVWGVPAESHFAQVLVEADYRMKLLSLGLETSPVKGFKSHLAMAPARGNSMQRWWITPLYDSFNASDDRNAFKFNGQRAQLMSQEEVSDNQGHRTDAATTRVTTQKWAKLFTDKYPDIAASTAIFAELQNLFDLAVVAALLQKERIPQKVNWSMSLFLDGERATIAKGNAPRQVPTVANFKVAQQSAITGIVGGGVVLNPTQLLREVKFEKDDAARLDGHRTSAVNRDPPDQHPWWWD